MLPECTRHPEGLALLQRCKENPRDLAPRLILSDWLEDQGEEEMANAIRVTTSGGRYLFSSDLKDRWKPIDSCKNGWLLSNIGDCDDPATNIIQQSPWLGGLCIGINGNCEEYLSILMQQLKESNFIRLEVVYWHTSTRRDRSFQILAESKLFKQLIHLNVYGGGQVDAGIGGDDDDPFFEILTKTQFDRNLDTLILTGFDMSTKAMRLLAQSPILSPIKNLKLYFNNRRMPARTLVELAQSPHLRNLVTFDFYDICSRGNVGINLAKAQFLSKLTRLSLTEDRMGDRGIQALAASPYLNDKLEELDICANGITTAGIKRLLEAKRFTNLRLLDLRWNPIGDDGLAALASSESLRSVRHLSLGNGDIGPTGIKALAESKNCVTLEKLELGGNIIGDGLGELANSTQINLLKRLMIDRSELKDDNVLSLFSSPMISRLIELDLQLNELTDKSVSLLIKSKQPLQLQALNLRANGITDSSAIALLNATETLPHLRELNLECNEISDSAKLELQQLAIARGINLKLGE